jgi:hypothetical protein
LENNRSDHLAGTGRANNAKPKGKNLYMEGLPTIPPIKTMEDMGDMEDIDDDHEKTAPVDPEDIGKPPKRNTRAWEDYRERKAKADWAEMRVRKEKGELLERTDVLAVYGATLNGLKTGVLSLPQRTTMKIMGIVKEWMATQNIAVDANRLIFLEKSVQDAVAAEITLRTDRHIAQDRERNTGGRHDCRKRALGARSSPRKRSRQEANSRRCSPRCCARTAHHHQRVRRRSPLHPATGAVCRHVPPRPHPVCQGE